MSRLPWMKFFPPDWMHDTRRLSLASRGMWMDLLCVLWPAGTKTMTELEWVRELSVSPEEFRVCLDELNHGKTAHVTVRNNLVTVESRRMLREASTRESTRNRVKRFREAHQLQVSNGVEARSQRLEEKKEKEKDTEKRPLRGSIFPDGFQPDARHEDMAKGLGVNLQAEFAQFKDHHTAKGTIFKDWPAAFRTWIRNAAKFKERTRK